MSRRLRRWARCASLVLLVTLLTGCFKSEKPLITETDAVMPLPARFSFVALNKDGTIKLPDANASSKVPQIKTVERSAYQYVGPSFISPNTLTFADLDHSGTTFLIQSVGGMFDGEGATYGIARYTGSRVAIYSFPDVDAASVPDGADHTTSGEVFKDLPRLLAAARKLEQKTLQGQPQLYRIASTPDEIAQMQRDVEGVAPHSSPNTSQAAVEQHSPGRAFMSDSWDRQRAYLDGAAEGFWIFRDAPRENFSIDGNCAEGEIRRLRHGFESPMLAAVINSLAQAPNADLSILIYDYLNYHCQRVGVDWLGGEYILQLGNFIDQKAILNVEFMLGMMDMTRLVYERSNMPGLALCTKALIPNVLRIMNGYIFREGRRYKEFVVQVFQNYISENCPH